MYKRQKYGDKEGFDLARFEISGAGFNQKEKTAEISEIRLSKGNLSLSREANGSISALSLLKQSTVKSAPPLPQPSGSAVPQATAVLPAVSPGKQAAKDFSFRLKKFQLDSFNIAVTDKTVSDKPRFTLKNSSLSLSLIHI